ncbi:MAG: NAD(P)H-dependent oxidoreductase subunit E [Candidatus Cloacimonetes bacterium]|nr:NAD(P)H-dependent oxidoreductase subunit E [Candidatus Cloacimonadota bacterium]
MDILIDIQTNVGCISKESVKEIAENLNISKVDVEQTLSFYHFFSEKPTGKYAIYLNDSAVANMMGRSDIAKALEEEVGCKFGSVTEDCQIGLFDTACIGMNDQEPSAIINQRVFTNLTKEKVKLIVNGIKNNFDVNDIQIEGYCQATHKLITSNVCSNIKKEGPILTKDMKVGDALKKVILMDPNDVIELVKQSNLRGRGGAGFPTGMKWQFCRAFKDEKHYIFCNADEGEPGTFKDRVILTERPELLFEGMAIAGYSIGSDEGILYLRYEYKYLQNYLEDVLSTLREQNLLGKDIGGKAGLNFDIRIQFGGGAYVCGEESALIESAEGKRGEPRDRPPFPVEKGYLQKPTVVNNVETLCAVTKIIHQGPKWYRSLGTLDSTGSKVMSISGDCDNPGIYEIEWGFTVNDILEMVGAKDVQAVQVGGPSGSCIASNEFKRKLAYEDLATGGSMIIIGKHRDLIKDIVMNFTDFFIEESCGSCVPCRAMTVQFKNKLEKIYRGNGVQEDIDQMLEWGKVMKMNRCGLGHTAANPILTTLKNFRELYTAKLQKTDYVSEFNLEEAVQESCAAAGRIPNLGGDHE